MNSFFLIRKRNGYWLFVVLAVFISLTVLVKNRISHGFVGKGLPGQIVECHLELKEDAKSANYDRVLLYLPKEYSADSTDTRWPLLLFLHGSWQRGRDLNLVRSSGIPSLIAHGEDFASVIVAPQCAPDKLWDLDALFRMIDHIQRDFNVDKDRLYVTGFEIGGCATWELAARMPDRFAAIVPISGYPQSQKTLSQWLNRTNCWTFTDRADRAAFWSELTAQFPQYWKTGGDARLTELMGNDQSLSTKWTEVYDRAGIFPWLLQKRRKGMLDCVWSGAAPGPGSSAKGSLTEQTSDELVRSLIQFEMQLPYNYVVQGNRAYPLILCLDGSGQASESNNASSVDSLSRAIGSTLNDRSAIFVASKGSLQDKFESTTLSKLLDYLRSHYTIDSERIYLIGAGRGATAAWELALSAPLDFAAMALIGFMPPENPVHEIHALAGIPKWYFATRADSPRLNALISYERTHASREEGFWRPLVEPKQSAFEGIIESRESSLAKDICDWLLTKNVVMRHRYDHWPGNNIGFNEEISPIGGSLFAPKLHKYAHAGRKAKSFDYQLFMPKPIRKGMRYPLIIWMHGHGDAELNCEAGQLRYMDLVIRNPSKPENYPFYMIAMQCPKDSAWPGEPIAAVMQIVEGLCHDYPIDKQRISMVGISSGGTACWEVASKYPGILSAIAPLSSTPSGKYKNIDLQGTSVWAFNNMLDFGAPPAPVQDVIEAAKRHGATNVRLTTLRVDGHHTWTEAFLDYDLLQWLIAQRRKS